jgi:hypothetical protein
MTMPSSVNADATTLLEAARLGKPGALDHLTRAHSPS